VQTHTEAIPRVRHGGVMHDGAWPRYSAMQKSRIVRLAKVWHFVREWLLNDGRIQKPLGTKLDSGTIPNALEGFWIRSSFKDHFLSRRAKP
jgi:hypothetical protein